MCTTQQHFLQISKMYWSNLPIDPVHMIADHAPAMANVATSEWPELDEQYQFFLQCFPHLKINMRKKRGLFRGRKADECWNLMMEHADILHSYPGSVDMFQVMAEAYYNVWAYVWKQKGAADWFWNEYCCGNWNNWSLCMVEMGGASM